MRKRYCVTARLPRRLASLRGVAVVNLGRFRTFVAQFTRLADTAANRESVIFERGRALPQALIGVDDWLPSTFARPDPERYRQYLLHGDPLQRFCVLSFVWDRDQTTPIHNHSVGGMIGMLWGAEIGTRYGRVGPGAPLTETAETRLKTGHIDLVSPAVGDIHRVRNAHPARPSISIHVYGANVGAVRRSIFTPAGDEREFISGYSNELMPILWDRSR
jgi:3-mercaptopropionate dioxygenase